MLQAKEAKIKGRVSPIAPGLDVHSSLVDQLTHMKNISHKWPLMRPEVTFNDFKGQQYIAYDTSVYTMSMHAKNQVNWCSGKT